jgi:hypothetical protein
MPSANGHGLKRSVLWAILYARVSTDEQARSGYSLAQQLEALREYAAREGYEVLEEVVDPGQSGASLERPGLDRVRDLVAAGGVAVVLAQDRDRFSREPAYTYLLRSEFVIAVCASIGFLFGLSLAEVPWTIVAALFVGGLIAAPIAAYIVRVLPTRIMGTAVGGFILVVNANTFFGAIGLASSVATMAFILIIAVWIAALAFAIGARIRKRR